MSFSYVANSDKASHNSNNAQSVVKVKSGVTLYGKPITELQSIICHMALPAA